ncbi:MAG TPA: MFS transporter [Pseudosphingobacterium sp.]|nr:MFS transporter [Pseudosphingobacterium sp.]
MTKIVSKKLSPDRQTFSTLLAFALIPLSGFATDVYIPSLPDMADSLHTSASSIQATLAIFLISYGATQLFIGSVLDSYGRYIPNLLALLLFSLASFIIANATSIGIIYAMRAVHGFAVAIIIVSKRSYFVDLFSGEQLKHYTSLFSIVWATAPIIAPFLGGFLQVAFGWQANFYFLGLLAIILFVLELFFSGETLRIFETFSFRSISRTYWKMIRTTDFTMGIVVLGLTYGALIVFGMASPFLIEKTLHYPAVATGNISLISGLAVLGGGMISKLLLKKTFQKKLIISAVLMIVVAVGISLFTLAFSNLYTLIAYVVIIHTSAGFIFNNMLSYCLIRFPNSAGKAGGLAGGGFSIVTSIFSYLLADMIGIQTQAFLGVAYTILALGTLLLLVFTPWKSDY